MSLVKVEIEGPLARLTLDRPEQLNALGNAGDGDAMAAACEQVNADMGVRCAILTGAGRAFSAGGDVAAMQAREGTFAGTGGDIRRAYRRNVHRIVQAVYGLEVPLIAAVNGPAVGLGCDVACLADIRIASSTARFGVSFLKLGLIPGDGGAWLLPRTVGMSRAAELLFTGDLIDAATAERWGLVSQVVAPEALKDAAEALARRIARQPPHALRMAKTLLREGRSASFESVMELSAAAQGLAHTSEEHAEGVAAFLEKREPRFSGR